MDAPGGERPSPERLRFQDFTFERLPNGHCRARVVLSWADGRQFIGEAEGVISQAGELRCSAGAAVRALERVVQPKLGFEVLGVKAVRASSAVVIGSSRAHRDECNRLGVDLAKCHHGGALAC